MAQDDLEKVVEQMMAAGKSDEEIDAAVQQYDQANPSLMETAGAVNDQPGLIPDPTLGTPGILGAAGILAQNANKARPALAMVGKGVQMAANAPAAIGGTIGATVGGMLGSQSEKVGLPLGVMGGATLGATAGRGIGRKVAPYVQKAGKGIERAFSLSTPRATIEEALAADGAATKAASYAKKVLKLAPRSNVAAEAATKAAALKAAIPKVGAALKFSPARKVVNALGSRILPGVGTALMIADAANTGYKVGGYLDNQYEPGDRPSDTVGRLTAPLFGSSAKEYDAMVKALMDAEAKK